jgi:hypothetical protein
MLQPRSRGILLTVVAPLTAVIFFVGILVSRESIPVPTWALHPTFGSTDVEDSFCNPFQSPGFLDDANDWVPYDGSCPTVRRANLTSMMPSLRNKRVFFYGDSVIRNAAIDFCHKTLGIDHVTLEPNPPGYLTTSDLNKVHKCRNDDLNLTVINSFQYGLREWDETDLPFLKKHPHFAQKEGVDVHSWAIEQRMVTPREELVKRYGEPDMIVLGSGLWDTMHLQRYLSIPENNRTQTKEAPSEFLQHYATRVHDFIQLAHELHPNAKLVWLTLHDPIDFLSKGYGMDGYPASGVKYGALSEPRVRGIREATLSTLVRVKRDGLDLEVLPYDLFVRASPDGKQMRDKLHPHPYVNTLLGTALLWVATTLK